MLIKLNEMWYVDASLISAVRVDWEKEDHVRVNFHDGAEAHFPAPKSEVERIAGDVNCVRLKMLTGQE